jgi:single-stranded-DNA-specific exonuclease
LQALANAARINEPLTPYHLGYMVGPRINAGGRIGDAALGARLLVTDDAGEALAIAAKLDELNTERQAIEARMLEEALAEAEAEMARGDGPPVIIAANDSWHPGVAGILAARLKERFHRPAFAVAFNPSGIGTGSGRSITGFDLGRLVRQAVDAGLIIKGGGHAMAAGLTVEKNALGALRSWMDEHAAKAVAKLSADRALTIDAALSAEAATPELHAEIERAGPYGTGNPSPMFVLPFHTVRALRWVGNGHLKLTLAAQTGATIEAMLFRADTSPLGEALVEAGSSRLHIAGSLSRNFWQGRERIELRVVDAVLA